PERREISWNRAIPFTRLTSFGFGLRHTLLCLLRHGGIGNLEYSGVIRQRLAFLHASGCLVFCDNLRSPNVEPQRISYRVDLDPASPLCGSSRMVGILGLSYGHWTGSVVSPQPDRL